MIRQSSDSSLHTKRKKKGKGKRKKGGMKRKKNKESEEKQTSLSPTYLASPLIHESQPTVFLSIAPMSRFFVLKGQPIDKQTAL